MLAAASRLTRVTVKPMKWLIRSHAGIAQAKASRWFSSAQVVNAQNMAAWRS